MEAVEATGTRFRPERITTLFVGESAPASGDFFYYGNTAMLRYMREAVEDSLGESGDFFERFKAYGWFLDDLVLTPVDELSGPARKAKCLHAQTSLATRIQATRDCIAFKTYREKCGCCGHCCRKQRPTICRAIRGSWKSTALQR